MFSVEIRVNGTIVDFIHVKNIDITLPDGRDTYQVNEYPACLLHYKEDGIIILASKALKSYAQEKEKEES